MFNFKVRAKLDLSSHLHALAKSVVHESVQETKRDWSDKAKSRLGGDKAPQYMQGIQSSFKKEDNAKAYTGTLHIGGEAKKQESKPISAPTRIDMKESFKNSPKRKIAKDGDWYLHVPIKSGRPTTTMMTPNFEEHRDIESLPVWGATSSPATSGSHGWGHTPSSPTSTSYGGSPEIRTVGAKSDPNSWIREEVKEIGLQDEMQRGIKDIFSDVFRKATDHIFGE